MNLPPREQKRILRTTTTTSYAEHSDTDDDNLTTSPVDSSLTNLIPDDAPKWLAPLIQQIHVNLRKEINDLRLEINDSSMKLNQTIATLESNMKETRQFMDSLKTETDGLKVILTQKDTLVENLTRRVETLERNLQKIETVERKQMKKEAGELSNHLIISGESVPAYTNEENTKEITDKIIRDCCRLNLSNDSIHHAHRTGKPPPDRRPVKRRIKLYLSNSETKSDIVRAAITFRESTASGLYINEELLPSVDTLFYHLRALKKDYRDKIFALHTRNGIIRVKKTRGGEVTEILTEDEFGKFLALIGLPNPIASSV